MLRDNLHIKDKILLLCMDRNEEFTEETSTTVKLYQRQDDLRTSNPI